MFFPRAPQQTDQSDIARWGIAALVAGSVAILSANIAAFIPGHMLMGLHSTRLSAGNLNQLGSRIEQIQLDSQRTARDTRMLIARLDLLDDDSGETVRRLAAVERSLPLLIESLPLTADIDRSLLTASILSTGGEVYEAQGGTIVIRQSSLFADLDEEAGQPMPPVLEAMASPRAEAEFGAPPLGLALGFPVQPDAASVLWAEIAALAGDSLMGSVPLLATDDHDGLVQIVAGPFAGETSTATLCSELTDHGIKCSVTAYEAAEMRALDRP